MKQKGFDKKMKQSVQKVVLGYKKKRENAISKLNITEEDYKKKMTAIRQKPFESFEENLTQAKKALTENGFVVHEANTDEEAREIVGGLCQGTEGVVKSKTNTAKEVELEKVLDKKKTTETDLGDSIISLFDGDDQHYVLPAIHISAEEISKKIEEKYGDKVSSDPEKLTRYLCGKIRKKILEAQVGITGANFFTKTGQIILLENEGNISLISRIPQKHVVLVGIDKIAETVEDATTLCKTAAIFGTGQDITQYISIISGPSKTADIENKLVHGAQGAKEVHVVLIDNGRSKMIKEDFGELLRCINCGACINFCPAYHQSGNEYGGKKYIGAKGLISGAFSVSLEQAKKDNCFDCTLCGNCSENCPMSIPLDEMIRKIRSMQHDKGLQTTPNKEMIEKIKKHGNPFGDVAEGDIPDKLYCC